MQFHEKNFFLIHLISRVFFFAWTFLNFLAHHEVEEKHAAPTGNAQENPPGKK